MSRALADRFIPAFAGTTSAKADGFWCKPVHPRVRGDHDAMPSLFEQKYGSSPRSRGPLQLARRTIARRWFIPAFAGTTLFVQSCIGVHLVHPRVRGDHACAPSCAAAAAGSSPRSRGPPRLGSEPVHAGRFIPAFAGTTTRHRSAMPTKPVHPRVRGDHRTSNSTRRQTPRFIPAFAGTTSSSEPSDARRRFIPAFAGTT